MHCRFKQLIAGMRVALVGEEGTMRAVPARLRRRSLIGVVAALLLLSVVSPAAMVRADLTQGSTFSQVWGARTGDGGYSGSEAYAKMYEPNITSGWAVGPIGTTGYTAPPYIESGPMKDCNFDCNLHAYASWGHVNGNRGFAQISDRTLASGGYYKYGNFFIGGDTWHAYWCDGSGCGGLASPNLGSSYAMPYAVSGGESSCFQCSIGDITTSENKFDAWVPGLPWCYTETHNNVGGSISGCLPDQRWIVIYDR